MAAASRRWWTRLDGDQSIAGRLWQGPGLGLLVDVRHLLGIAARLPDRVDALPFELSGGAESQEPGAIALMGALPNIDSTPGVAPTGQLVVLFGEDLGPGTVIDTATRTLMPGAAGDYPELGTGSDDVLVLSGDFSAGAVLPVGLHGLDGLVVRPGGSYRLASGEDNVAPGGTLVVNAMALGPGEHVDFDGSAETDGAFVFFGSAGDDLFIGGAGDDRILGMGGADRLTGGGGADVFAFESAGQSSAAAYDTLVDFDPRSDRIDLPVAVTGFAAAVAGGTLSAASFDADLAAALGSGLGAGQARLFAPDAGDLAGTLFLVVDGNGEAGYQPGEDFVFALPNAGLADLGGSASIFV